MVYFYRLNGSRVKVTKEEREKRWQAQERRAEKRGEIIWRPRRNGPPKSLTPDEYESQQIVARRASIVRQREEQKEKEERFYDSGLVSGPDAFIETSEDAGRFIAEVVEAANIVAAYDGRDRLAVEAIFTFTITAPDGDTFTIERDSPIIFINKRVRGGQYKEIDPNDFRALIMKTLVAQDIGNIGDTYRRRDLSEQERDAIEVAGPSTMSGYVANVNTLFRVTSP